MVLLVWPRPRGPHDDEFASPLLDRLLFAGQLVCERRNNEESRCRLSLSASFAAVHQLGSNWRHTGLVTDIVIPSKVTRSRVRQESWQRIGGESPREGLANHPDPE